MDTMKKTFDKRHLALASALTLLIGGALGYLVADMTSEATPQSASLQNACPELASGSNSWKALVRTAGSGDTISSRSTDSSATDSYRSSCFVTVDGKTRLTATAELAQSGDISTWEKSLSENGDIGPSSGRMHFSVGGDGKGISAANSAAIYLKCSPQGSKITAARNLAITVASDSSTDASSRRTDLAEIAVAFAKHAQDGAHCSTPVKLPVGPPKLSDD
ncbi:hypothetical protein [Streptomyces sp. NPDC054834]